MIEFLIDFARETWNVFQDASLYILFGFLAAAAIHYWVSPQRIYRFFGRHRYGSILLASVAGIPLPLCSCSTVPTAMALRRNGASRGATVSFLISTPETSADSIALTYGLMDLPMAIFRPVASLLTALAAGLATEILGAHTHNNDFADEKSSEKSASCCSICCSSDNNDILSKTQPSYLAAFHDLFDEMSTWMLLGLVLSGAIAAAVPSGLIESYLGGGIVSMLIMLAVSVPLYMCASSSTPVAAALILKGMSPGAALVFLLAGPATNVATITMLWKLLGGRILLIYLLSIIIVALCMGIAVDYYYTSWNIDPIGSMSETSELLPDWLKMATTFIFIAIMVRSMWRKFAI